jgi:cellulose synthase/poly-beta-1,6-N-acetylglucosamine synthase-like glycosyltransferase
MAVRREALRDAGGFEGLRYSVTEDAQLIAQVRESGRWDIQAIRRRGARVIPAPETDVKSLFRQNLRWNTGGFFAPDAKTRASYALVMGYLFLSVLALPFAGLQSLIALPALGSFISMLMLGVLAGILNEPGLRYWLWLIPNVLFSMVFYSFVTMMTLFRIPVSWKGRSLSPHSR